MGMGLGYNYLTKRAFSISFGSGKTIGLILFDLIPLKAIGYLIGFMESADPAYAFSIAYILIYGRGVTGCAL